MIPIGVAGAACAYFWNRRRGSNDVGGSGGAADAAFGGLPRPGRHRRGCDVLGIRAGFDAPGVRQANSPEMATIEFVPPRGLEPWQGMALLREMVTTRPSSPGSPAWSPRRRWS